MWGGGPVGKNSVVFKNWRSLEKNTEREGERGRREKGRGGRWRDKEGGGEASSAYWKELGRHVN